MTPPSVVPQGSGISRHAANETAVNTRDRNGRTLTPMDQSEKRSDLEVTRRIRRALIKDESLSVDGKNIKVITIDVPPLRARLDDVAELAHYFLFRFNRELGMDLRAFAPQTLELLQNYGWPGNVRELQSVLKQAMFKATGHVLLPEFLPDIVRRGAERLNSCRSLKPPEAQRQRRQD